MTKIAGLGPKLRFRLSKRISPGHQLKGYSSEPQEHPSFPGRLSALNFCRGLATRVPPAEHGLLKYITYSINTRTPLSHLSVTTSCEVLTVGRHTEEP